MIEQPAVPWRLRDDRADRARARTRRARSARVALERRASRSSRPLPAPAAHEVDLLDLVLADVADREVAGAAVEREAPRVAQAVGVDLAARAGAADERVRARDACTAGRRRAAGRCAGSCRAACQALRVAARAVLVAAAAAVAGADVEQVVGAEEQQAAVVVGLAGRPCARTSRAVAASARSALARAVLDDALSPVAAGEVDVEAPRSRVVGREGDRQQALLAAGRDLARDVEERLRELRPSRDDADPPGLLDDAARAVVAGRRGGVSGDAKRRATSRTPRAA